MMGEKISVIVPVYNVEAYLEKCVESILKQTYTNLEILLVNDGSTDTSGELCDQLAQRDQRIRVIHKENSGLSDARNRGIEEASSDLIGFIDSDDYIDEDMYEILYRQMLESNADLSMCGHYDVYHQIPEKQVAAIQTWELTPQEAIKMVMEAKILSVTAVNKLYKKEVNVIYNDNQNNTDIPFIQANSFERIISLMEILSEEDKTTEEIADIMQFDLRQSDYYYNAGKYLGLFEKVDIEDEGKTIKKVSLSKLGKDTVKLRYKERQLKLVGLILQHDIFYRLFINVYNSGELPTKEEIQNIMRNNNICNASQIVRRSSSVYSWVKWIFNLQNI